VGSEKCVSAHSTFECEFILSLNYAVFDSSAKFPSDGVLQGNFVLQFGHYDQCLATRGPEDDDGVPRFKGKYCRVQLGFKANKNNTDPKSELLLTQMKIAYDSLSQTKGGANYLTELQVDAKVNNSVFLYGYEECI
jgi:Nose resistant-to-fluoxetine protein, N-terminal domain